MDSRISGLAARASLVEVLRERAALHPDTRVFTFLEEGSEERRALSFGALDAAARRLAGVLQARCGEGERAVLLYPPGLEYVTAFLGCLYAGLVAVPAYPPDPSRLGRTLPRLKAIIEDCDARLVLTTGMVVDLAAHLFELAPELAAKEWLATDRLESTPPPWRPFTPRTEALAFLQYTSGSTGTPRGVMLTHGNLMANEEAIRRAFEHDASSVGVGWLPLYHDMGLIGNVLQPIYAGFPCTLFSPLEFLRHPARWLEEISRERATTSGGPNFGYELCLRKVSEEVRAGLDLRSWRVAYNGAEPVRGDTLARFARAFAPQGFNPTAFYPCYGLAESTLIVTGGSVREAPVLTEVDREALERGEAVAPGDRERVQLVSSGRPVVGQHHVIVDPASGTRCPEGRVGEIWVRGASVAAGYWRAPEATARAFGALLEGVPHLRTGDLGFLRDGELFVTGRQKDLIIIRGRNLYPADLERTVEGCHPAIRGGGCAAFSVDAGTEERLVVAAEFDERRLAGGGESAEDPRHALARRIQSVLASEHAVKLEAVVLLPSGSIPKTSSGKIQRFECRRSFVDGEFEPYLIRERAAAAPEPLTLDPEALRHASPEERADRVREFLRSRAARVLRLAPEQVELSAPMGSLGLDSVAAVELAHELEAALGAPIPVTLLLSDLDLRSVASRCADARAEGPVRQAPRERAPLSAGQEALYVLHRLAPQSAAYNLFISARIRSTLDPAAMGRALEWLIARHPSLRRVVVPTRERPEQHLRDTGLDFQVIDATGGSPSELRRAVEDAAHEPFALEQGPLCRVRLFQVAPEDTVLLLSAHHLAADFWSLLVLMRELHTLDPVARAGQPPPLPPTGADYVDHVAWEREALASEAMERSRRFWRDRLERVPPPVELSAGEPRPRLQRFEGGELTLELRHEQVDALRELARREGATLYTVLLAAFSGWLARRCGQEELLIGTLHAGRSRAALRDVVGYFVNPVVHRVDVSRADTFRAHLARTRTDVLAELEHAAYPFARLVEELAPQRDPSRSPFFDVLFSFEQPHLAGLEDAALLASGAAGARLDLGGLALESFPMTRRGAQFDLALAMVHAGHRLVGSLQYNTALLSPEEAHRLVRGFVAYLEAALEAPDRPLHLLPEAAEPDARWAREVGAGAVLPIPEETIAELFETQARRTPQAIAVSRGEEQLTYADLDAAAERLAGTLRARGAGPECVVGLSVERSVSLVVALLGILKSGAAYLPLDPSYPRERLDFMLADSGARLLVTGRAWDGALPRGVEALRVDAPGQGDASPGPARRLAGALAYVLYTSGSTGQPKGVMVSQRNVVGFFTALDALLAPAPPMRWLAVTSISFDISVLELLWTLTRGASVELHDASGSVRPRRLRASAKGGTRAPGFSLFYFADDAERSHGDRYRLLLEGARFADRHGFEAVWTPERHFHAFGGLYPNPAITAAALASATERVHLRAGSLVLPLHHPVRVAEDWSLVDNLSRGRVGLSVASGWHPTDFVLAPERFAERKALLRDGLQTLRRLWRGESVTLPDGNGHPVEVVTRPRPLQPELPLWVTAAGDPATFQLAGELGCGVLTHLLGQTEQELVHKLELYRAAYRAAGHPEGGERVTLMLHTFVGDDDARVRERVRGPFTRYLRSSADLMRSFGREQGAPAAMSDEALDAAASRAFERYVETSGLFGTPARLEERVRHLAQAGVTEVACLIDFGVDEQEVLDALPALDALRERVQREAPRGLAEQLDARSTTHLQCTPSLARVLLDDPSAGDGLRRLEALLVGGEALSPELAQGLRSKGIGRVLNMYGPTETTVWSTAHALADDERVIPIGRPLGNTQVYVLDPRLRPVAPGAPGELFIGGEGVTRGYLGRPGLTAERFVPDPFGTSPGARLYKTGDLARFDAHGHLRFLGRVDQQVKIRGHRIEPGEIESALLRHPAVREAVVTALEDGHGGHRLVAHVVGRGAARPSEAVLRAHLERLLPAHMLPSAFVALDALPRTPNGKLDRRALPPAAASTARAPEPPPAAMSPLEQRLATLWCEVLRISTVRPDQNFFELGGDSILALQVVSRAQAAGLRLTAADLFEHPTLAALATVCREEQGTKPLEAPAEGAVPLAPIQRWLLGQDLARVGHYNHAMVLALAEGISAESVAHALDHVVAHHEAFRVRFFREGTTWRQEVTKEQATLPLETLDASALSGEGQERISRHLSRLQVSLDLERGPLARAVYLDFGAGAAPALALILHHLIVDGVSWRILLEELETVLGQLADGAPVSPLPRDDSWASWARTLWTPASLERYRKDLPGWRKAAAPAAPLPVDAPRGDRSEGSAATREVTLTEAETTAFLRHAQAAYRTRPEEMLLTAVAHAFVCWTGTPQLRIDLEAHGREGAAPGGLDLTRTVGWLTALYPARLELDGAGELSTALKRVKEQLRALPREKQGFGVLHDAEVDLPGGRWEEGAPAEILFNYLGQGDGAFRRGGLLRPFLAEAHGGGLWPARLLGPLRAPENRRSHLFEINALVTNDRLSIVFTYSPHIHLPSTLERIVDRFTRALRELITHCTSPGVGGHTPSDFPLARVSQQDLDTLLASLRKR